MTANGQAKRVAEDGLEFSVATAPASARHRRLALAVIIATLLAYVSVVPNAATPLPAIPSFIPSIFAIIFVADLVTSVLLYAQFSTTGSHALLALASGYLFSSLMVVGHVLTFPGVFSATGLLGAGPQSAAWLNVLWRFGLFASVAGYAVLRSGRRTSNAMESAPRFAISRSVAIVVVVVCTLIFAVTTGHDLWPPVLLNGNVLPLGRYANAAITLMGLFALVLLLMLPRGRSILDTWLMVVVVTLLAESILTMSIAVGRYSVAFYANRLISLPVSKVVLVVLLWETMRLYAGLAISNRELRRERASRLTNAAAAVAAIAHDIRQPLTGIHLLAAAGQKLLNQTPPDVDSAKTVNGKIKDAAFQANEVFDNLLRLFRGGDQSWQVVDVNALALEATRLVRKNLDEHNVTANTELASDLPVVRGHVAQLREVIINLLQNAIDAMAPTTDAPRVIRIATSRPGPRTISISVQDTGPGIVPEKMAGIFDPFAANNAKGTGLGLAICKMIVDQHGGELSATSGENGGARFEITLPAGTASPAARATSRT